MSDTARTMPPEPRPAGFWVRAAARTLDIVVILAVYVFFYHSYRKGADAGLWLPIGVEEIPSYGFSPGRVLFGIFVFGFPVFYYVYLHGSCGQTFGKMAFRIRVVNEDGSPLNFRQSFLRWLGYFLSGWLTLCVGYLWAGFDRRKQAFHDKVCRTLVIHV